MMKQIIFLILIFTVCFKDAKAFIGDGGAGYVQIPYLIQIVQENVKRHKQLEDIQKFERLLHKGTVDIRGLMNLVPIDRKTASYLREIVERRERIKRIYGNIPKSPERPLHKENDDAIAESMALKSQLEEYTQKQEKNATQLAKQARSMSPKGAAQAAVISNAQILHALNQLIKINGQILKLQGQILALENREEKEDVKNFYRDTESLKKGFKQSQSPLKLAKF